MAKFANQSPTKRVSKLTQPMRITKVAPATRTAGRYNIFVDGHYSFSLDEFQLVQHSLHSGQEIDETKLAEFQAESDFGKNYIRAVDLISRRLRSEREIRDYARRKQWSRDNTERVIARLYDRGYLNDLVFAQSFVRSRQSSRKYSHRRIERDLVNKGISHRIIQQVLDEKASMADDNDALTNLVAKKYHRYDDINKLKAYLARAGFRYDDINRAIEQYHNSHSR